MKFSRKIAVSALMMIFLCACHHPYEEFPSEHPQPWTPSEVEVMLGGSDPMEGFNRSMFSCTDFLMCYVADPLGRVYTTIFPRPFIEHFDNVCVNLEYPARAVSSLLQAEWKTAGRESVRFLANTTLGVVGIFDVAQAWWHIPPAEMDFGQAFASWGIGSGDTFMLPIASAMNGRDLTGMLFDTAFDLKTYIPYAGYATFLNRMAVMQDGYSMVVRDAADPYKNYRQMMLLRRELQLRMWIYQETLKKIAEWEALQNGEKMFEMPPVQLMPIRPDDLPHGKYTALPHFFPQGGSQDTIRMMFAQVQRKNDKWYMPLSLFNGDFISDADFRSLEIAADAPKVRYAFWKTAESENSGKTADMEKLVVMLPGIGGTYTESLLLAVAEKFHDDGYMVVTLDSTFNWHFVVSAGEYRLPGYLPADTANVRKVILSVLEDLKADRKINDPQITVCGYSMGGIQTLKLADMEAADEQIGVHRFISINPPVSLKSAMLKIDKMASASAGWTKEEMREKLISAGGRMLMKFAAHYPHLEENADVREAVEYLLPLDEESAKVIAGIFLKMSMREMLFAVHREKPVIGFPEYRWSRRTELYQHLDRITFEEYASEILAPCYPEHTLEELFADSDLHSIEDTLASDERIRVFHNADDMLVADAERRWLDSVLKDRLHWFSNGGHLGNLYYRRVLDEIVSAAE